MIGKFSGFFSTLGVMILTGIANKCGRLTKVKKVEQFIMASFYLDFLCKNVVVFFCFYTQGTL